MRILLYVIVAVIIIPILMLIKEKIADPIAMYTIDREIKVKKVDYDLLFSKNNKLKSEVGKLQRIKEQKIGERRK